MGIYPFHGFGKLLCLISVYTQCKWTHCHRQAEVRGSSLWFHCLSAQGITGAFQEQEGRNPKAQRCRTSICNSTSCQSTCIRKNNYLINFLKKIWFSRAFSGLGSTEAPLLQQTRWLLCQRTGNMLCLHTRAHLFHLSQLDPRAPLFVFVLPYPRERLYPMPWTSMSQKGHWHHHPSTIFVLSLPGAEPCQLPNTQNTLRGIYHPASALFVHCHPHGATDNGSILGFKA